MFLLKNISSRNINQCSTNILRFSSTIGGVLPEKEKSSQRNVNENLGQPTSWTHSHLLNEGEIVPKIKVDEFKERRTRLMQGIQKHTNNVEPTIKNHTVIVPSGTKKYMSDKIPYVFRQNSEFFYLTGCLEPDSVLVMTIDESSQATSTLFMRPKDKHAELWDGPRTGVDNSLELFGVDEAYPVSDFKAQIIRKTKEKSHAAIWYDEHGTDQHHLAEILRATDLKVPLKSPAVFMQSMRLFKSSAELDLMRKTCKIASEAINETMAEARPGCSEHHIFAMVDFKCRMKNASHLAYPPVVAAGNNATTIHYINNTQLVQSGDMVLMDAGCEYGGYTSDITRTWPISGEFTEPQKVLYDVILTLQKDLLGILLREGGDTLDTLFETMCIRLGKYLKEVGLIPAHITNDQAIARAAYNFCPHHVSHYLGMDVHDTPLMSRSMKLVPGMVCTVEPGIYIAKDRLDVPKEFRGLGIRIEDDVYIADTERVEILTSDCIKERSSLESLLKSKSQ
ncbi:xaa-Pro aminopeptidase 3 [Episyrphus balteatus]|uniref:xaa-Pro aminopeptidase 3 n=1 Tax=Episyrphus balteatus TaxID=286459 RepID=UPI0024864EF4|nr:xaa-Pro aminopeptidase 3 [Episyrphus balteatus]